MTIITGPGYYASKAGKCEVKYVESCIAYGLAPDDTRRVWLTDTSEIVMEPNCIGNGMDKACLRITGKWSDPPPARHECWVIFWGEGKYQTVHASEPRPDPKNPAKNAARHMVELREGECEPVPLEPTIEMVRAGAEAYRTIGLDDPIATTVYRAMIAARPR